MYGPNVKEHMAVVAYVPHSYFKMCLFNYIASDKGKSLKISWTIGHQSWYLNVTFMIQSMITDRECIFFAKETFSIKVIKKTRQHISERTDLIWKKGDLVSQIQRQVLFVPTEALQAIFSQQSADQLHYSAVLV